MANSETAIGGLDRARTLMIHNPAAGSGGRPIAEAIRQLAGSGHRIDLRATRGRGDAMALARGAAAARGATSGGYGLVIAAGGDGTVNEVINGLAGADLPLAVLPLGTANCLALEIGLDLDPAAAARAIARGVPKRVCLGRLRCGAGGRRIFSLMAGAGFDAHVVAGVNPVLKRWIGKGAYVAESLRQLAVFRFPEYRVVVDGKEYRAASVVVANGRTYGGAYACAPDARLEEAWLHVCLFQTPGARAAVGYLRALRRRCLTNLPDYRIVTGRKVRIDGPAGDPVQADGDTVGALPVEIDIVPGALRLVMPGAADAGA